MRPYCFPPERAYALVDRAAILHNFCLISNLARAQNSRARTVAVVKANAYGHGIDAVLPSLLEAGCSFFAVATPREAFAVRRIAQKADILILGYTPPALAPELAEGELTQTVFSSEYAAALSAAARAARCRVSVHVKIDGGMCRLGFSPADPTAIARACRRRGLRITGAYTHFPTADTDPAATKAALARFLRCADAIRPACESCFLHTAASAAALTLPETVLDGIRPGLALYGLSPVPTALALRPALSLWAPVVQLRPVPPGTPIGYGGDFVTARSTLVGTLPIGYADGFPRALAGLSLTLHHGDARFPVPILGRVCMDQLMVDLTDTPAAVGDPIRLWSDAAAPAAALGTIPYEVLTSLSPRVKRLCTERTSK